MRFFGRTRKRVTRRRRKERAINREGRNDVINNIKRYKKSESDYEKP